MGNSRDVQWHKVAAVDDLPEGRVKTVVVGTHGLALVHYDGQYAAMDNRCPHQGGPLGEGSIETGADGACWLRCPWHGWDFDPLTGKSPGAFEDEGQTLYPVEVRDDGIYVGVEAQVERGATISDEMAETMVNWGISRVFGIVGHSNLGLADALRRQEELGNLDYIGVRHEGAAAFACSGYAKLSQLPAACLTIAGPGATNLLTGLWDARVDRAPVLALTGQVEAQVLGPGAFQEIDLASAFDAATCFSQTVLPGSKHAELMSLACKNALVRRDVAHLIFPDDVQTLPRAEQADAGTPVGRMGDERLSPTAESVAEAVAMIRAAKRPIVIAGYGARIDREQMLELAVALGAPLLTTFKAKGLIPDDHPNAAGVLGRSGTPIASYFMNESDLIVALGSSFSNHTGLEKKKPIIQIDKDPMHLGKFHPVALPELGDIGATCDQLLGTWGDLSPSKTQLAELAARWDAWRAEKSSRSADDRGEGVNSAIIFEALSEVAPANAVIAVDVGNNTYSFGRYFECREQDILMSGYLGSIGFSFPAAMGAWCAVRDFDELKGRKVISISGDGGFGQYPFEFTTAVKYGMDITHVLLNNGQLGKISKEQRAGEWEVWQTSLHNPDFRDFAESCGGAGFKVTEADSLRDALADALAVTGRPSLVEIMSDPELI